MDLYVHVPIDLHCEAFGQTYVEALAAGIPGIFTLSGIAPEFIKHNYNAHVVDYENTPQITEAMKSLLTSPAKSESVIKNGSFSVKQFDIEYHIKKLIAIYQE